MLSDENKALKLQARQKDEKIKNLELELAKYKKENEENSKIMKECGQLLLNRGVLPVNIILNQ